ncbi:hypothetical protein D3C87_1980240 [compost metagenome]
MSTGEEILPEHLNLSEAPISLEKIEQDIVYTSKNGTDDERSALKRLLESLTQTL